VEPAPATMLDVVRSAVGSLLIYLVRHGRTELNAAGALRGHLDVPLDDVGRKEAARLGCALARCQPRLVVTSPLRRAVETGDAIARAAGAPAQVDTRWVDRDYGPWAGVPVAEVIERFGSVDAVPGTEPASDVRDRALAAMVDMAGGSGLGPIVVVSHDVVIRSVLSALGRPEDVPQETGCFNTVQCDRTEDGTVTWHVLSVNVSPAVQS
jgi:broad specificity phosphatase PhoE